MSFKRTRDFSDLASLTTWSICTIQHLKLVGLEPPAVDLLKVVIRSMPALKTFRGKALEAGVLVDPFLKALNHPNPGTGPSLPHLRQVELTLPRVHFHDSVFLQFVESRWKPFSQFKDEQNEVVFESVNLTITGGVMSEGAWDRLHKHQVDRLRVAVHDRSGCVRTRWEKVNLRAKRKHTTSVATRLCIG